MSPGRVSNNCCHSDVARYSWCVIKDFDEANQDENPQSRLQNPPQQGAADKLGLVADGKPVQVGFHNALGKPRAF